MQRHLPLRQPEAYQWPSYVDFQKDMAFLHNVDNVQRHLPLRQPEAYQWPSYVDFQKDMAFLHNVDE